jgi:hypothetical protein
MFGKAKQDQAISVDLNLNDMMSRLEEAVEIRTRLDSVTKFIESTIQDQVASFGEKKSRLLSEPNSEEHIYSWYYPFKQIDNETVSEVANLIGYTPSSEYEHQRKLDREWVTDWNQKVDSRLKAKEAAKAEQEKENEEDEG